MVVILWFFKCGPAWVSGIQMVESTKTGISLMHWNVHLNLILLAMYHVNYHVNYQVEVTLQLVTLNLSPQHLQHSLGFMYATLNLSVTEAHQTLEEVA